MSHDDLPKLGYPPRDADDRDAVHIPIIPAVAAHKLSPGDHVANYLDGTYGHAQEAVFDYQRCPAIGIVDPFYRDKIDRGESFWLLLYPGSVTALRHAWISPAIDTCRLSNVPVNVSEAERANSEKWLRAWLQTHDAPDYETVLAIIRGETHDHPQWDFEYIATLGIDGHASIPAEFWDRVEVVLGFRVPPDRRARSFTCSC